MLRLRQYKACDAEKIASWIKDEAVMRKWGVYSFDKFPVTKDDINKKYIELNGGCEEDNFYPLTAFDENGVVGSMIMKFTNREKTVLRFGFVIVDELKRGMGYGKEMLRLALKYAFEILKAEKVEIGVFENNPSAYFCYKSLGFCEADNKAAEVYLISGEEWKYLTLEIEK